AAEFLQSWTPSCLIVEDELPDIAGLELIDQIRKRGLTAPAVLMTNSVDAETREQAKGQGTILVDSLDPKKLIAVVRAALDGGAGEDGSSGS
ncbi:MAG: hypothetical protein JOY90_14875, partial [Bradyrhizobium sp.]|nr:hypothetical protein [Bradyrhizobium sp.]